ncbi:MAG: group II truncated hemoglobin [Myxococcota bacterium]
MARRKRQYGDGDASFQAAGGEPGIRKWVEDFYQIMDTWPEARRIRDMHPDDLEISIDKLARFLCGWLGGPKLYREKYGPIALPRAHDHLPIDAADRDAWLACMDRALALQPFDDDFKTYLREQLAIPAERVRRVCAGLPARS